MCIRDSPLLASRMKTRKLYIITVLKEFKIVRLLHINIFTMHHVYKVHITNNREPFQIWSYVALQICIFFSKAHFHWMAEYSVALFPAFMFDCKQYFYLCFV